jgi:hypothetical protein
MDISSTVWSVVLGVPATLFLRCLQILGGMALTTPSSWLKASDISPLSSQSIKSFLGESHRKAVGQLKAAYETAQDPAEWDAAQAEYRRKKEEAEAEGEAEVDELEDEDEGGAAGGKRKRSAGEKKAKGKKAKTAKKVRGGSAVLSVDRFRVSELTI